MACTYLVVGLLLSLELSVGSEFGFNRHDGNHGFQSSLRKPRSFHRNTDSRIVNGKTNVFVYSYDNSIRRSSIHKPVRMKLIHQSSHNKPTKWIPTRKIYKFNGRPRTSRQLSPKMSKNLQRLIYNLFTKRFSGSNNVKPTNNFIRRSSSRSKGPFIQRFSKLQKPPQKSIDSLHSRLSSANVNGYFAFPNSEDRSLSQVTTDNIAEGTQMTIVPGVVHKLPINIRKSQNTISRSDSKSFITPRPPTTSFQNSNFVTQESQSSLSFNFPGPLHPNHIERVFPKENYVQIAAPSLKKNGNHQTFLMSGPEQTISPSPHAFSNYATSPRDSLRQNKQTNNPQNGDEILLIQK